VTTSLSDALAGAQFIAAMPPLPAGAASPPARRAQKNYEARNTHLKRIGDRGEAIVLAMEKNRLTQAGKQHLAAKIEHIAEKDDSVGYDILSFDETGAERPIEVKATTAPDLRLGFCITANELEQAATLPNYHIYFVFAAMSRKPRVLRAAFDP
jgi:hypothetical protein